MSRQTPLAVLPILLAMLALIYLAANGAIRHAQAQTIPTRTPTPSSEDATATAEAEDPGPNPTAPPTSTNRPPQPTATVTPIVLPPTPEAGFLPTAEPCSLEVTAQVLSNGLNVRSGPGLDYEIAGALVRGEVRPVVGRAADVAWWQIILADGVVGWVVDDLVAISGYIGNLPIVDAPEIDGATVTPGTPWAPTPRPQCTPPATATLSQLEPAEAETTTRPATRAGDETQTPTPEASTPTATATATVESATPTAGAQPTQPPPTAAPLPDENEDESNSALSLIIPGVAALLLLSGAGLFLLRRTRA